MNSFTRHCFHCNRSGFLREGLAVALGGNDGNPDSPPYTFTPEQLLDNGGASVSDTAFFAIAGDFSSYLLDRWGAANYVELNPNVPAGTSTNDVETAFSSTYGESISAAFTDRQNASQRYAAARIGFPECSLDPTPWTGNVWAVDGTLDCASNGISVNDALASLDATISSVDVPTDGTYKITLHSDVITPGQAFLLQRCVSGEQFQYYPSNAPISTHVVIAGQSPIIVGWLMAGRYFSQFSASTADRPSFNVALQSTGTVNNTCSGLTPFSLDNSDGVYAVPAGGQPVVVPFSTTQPRTATAVAEQASLLVCDGACDVSGLGCQTMTLGQTIALSPGHVYFVIGRSSGLHAFAGLAVAPAN